MTEPKTPPPFCFVDTNIWLYAFVAGPDAAKSARAKQLLEESAASIAVSSQVINEVCINLVRKANVAESFLRQLIRSFYDRYPVILVDEAVQVAASQLREKASFSFWDSLIIAAALRSGATTLYSEDMQAGLTVNERLTIVNPL